MAVNPFQKLKGNLNEQSLIVLRDLGSTLESLNKPFRKLTRDRRDSYNELEKQLCYPYNELENELEESFKKYKHELDFVSTEYYKEFIIKFSDLLVEDDENKLKKILFDLVNHNKECYRILSDQRTERKTILSKQRNKDMQILSEHNKQWENKLKPRIDEFNDKYLSNEETEIFVERINKYANDFRRINKAIDLMDSLSCKYSIVQKEYRALIPDNINHLSSLYSAVGHRLTDLIIQDGDCNDLAPSLDAINSLLVELNYYLPSHLTKPLEKLYAIPFCDCYKYVFKLDDNLEITNFCRQSDDVSNALRSTLKEVY